MFRDITDYVQIKTTNMFDYLGHRGVTEARTLFLVQRVVTNILGFPEEICC
jgi:hypothetical protein